jgi:peptide/nickel transport system substrate-binding protein
MCRATDGSLEPRLVTEWRIHANNPKVWVFHIREGVQFHDGSALPADDVVFSLNRARGTSSDCRGLHAEVTEVTSPEPEEVHVRMPGPAPLYIQNLTNTFIMSRAWTEANSAGTENFTVRNAIATGPYVLVSRDPEVRTVQRRFERLWDKAPQVTEMVILPMVKGMRK